MIGLDTNVIVRYIAQDDAAQSKKATVLIEALSSDVPGFITIVSLVEMVWVLQGCYETNRQEIIGVLETLLQTKELIIEQAETVWKAVRAFTASNADFADCMIEQGGRAAHCEYTATFDKNAAKTTGMRLV